MARTSSERLFLTALCAVGLLGACGRQPIGLLGTGGDGDGGDGGGLGGDGGGYGGDGGYGGTRLQGGVGGTKYGPNCDYSTCSKSQFCEFMPGLCGVVLLGVDVSAEAAPQRRAWCTNLPNACDDYFDPVCGCDNKTYSNDCERMAAGVSLSYRGACPVAVGSKCGGEGGLSCGGSNWCDPVPGQCNNPVARGICVSSNEIACPRLYQPVCGCDGQTYGSDCHRQQSGVAKAHDGECPPREFPLSAGLWGGEHIELNAYTPENSGSMRFDCGSATVDQALMVKESGDFEWNGTYTPGTGGGQSGGRPEPARFYGTVNGDYMTMVVEVSDRIVTKLQLGYQQMPTLFLCL